MLLNQGCAFVDIETTGGNVQRAGITEIAIHSQHPDGEIHRWQQLLNPGQHIPEFIQRLTGITPAMVIDKPYFDEIAAELYEQLEGAVFIAHNARFDYGFIKAALQHCGYRFQPKIVCTVKLAKALFPEWPSHSLDNICVQMGYHRDVAHRAMADVDAMHAFVDYAIETHGLETVNAAAQLQIGRSATPVNLAQSTIDELPNTPGVYHFIGEQGNLLYVGKSVRIKERVKSHFSESVRKAKELRMAQEIHDVRFQQTAGELSALLLENQQIKQLSPIYNRRQRPYKKLWSYYLEPQDNGLMRPMLSNSPVSAFNQRVFYGMYRSRKQAQKWLDALVVDNELCRKALGQETGSGACFNYQLKKCRGVCVGDESVAQYNLRLIEALDKQAINTWPFEGAAVFTEPECFDEHGQPLPHLHVVENWAWLGSACTQAEAEALAATAVSTEFDKETYQILRRFMGLASSL